MFKQNVVMGKKKPIEIPYLIENGAKTTFYRVFICGVYHPAALLLQTTC